MPLLRKVPVERVRTIIMQSAQTDEYGYAHLEVKLDKSCRVLSDVIYEGKAPDYAVYPLVDHLKMDGDNHEVWFRRGTVLSKRVNVDPDDVVLEGRTFHWALSILVSA